MYIVKRKQGDIANKKNCIKLFIIFQNWERITYGVFPYNH